MAPLALVAVILVVPVAIAVANVLAVVWLCALGRPYQTGRGVAGGVTRVRPRYGAAMKYTKLGNTGLKVSRICLGCMSYGEARQGCHPWALDEEASRPFYPAALEAGINFFDTANVYSEGIERGDRRPRAAGASRTATRS